MQETLRINPLRGLLLDYEDDRLLHLDSEGRWISYHSKNTRYHRTVDGEAVLLDSRGNRLVSSSHLEILIGNIHALLHDTLSKLKNNLYEISSQPSISSEDVAHLLTSGLKWDTLEYKKQQQLFEKTYPDPVPILPPDRYRDLVILPATGCPHGQCTFCAFYKNQQFHVLSDDEFKDHIQNVHQLFGSALKNRNGIFLGSASGLSVPQHRLLGILNVIHEELGIPKRGIAAFMDPHHLPKRDRNDYLQLHEKGLQQVTIGLETADPELRSQLGKSAKLDQISRVIHLLKEAGIQIALTILTGFDSSVDSKKHQKRTLTFLSSLPLTKRDIVYLSPLVSDKRQTTSDKDISGFKRNIKRIIPAQVVPYRIDRFSYLA